MSATPRGISPSSRCSATSRSATTSRSARSSSPGTLITKEFGLKKDKLLVTVYHDDDEAVDLWKKIAGFSDDRIIRIPTSDNFWAMGDTGPCGPCSEIFIDRGEHIWGGPPGSPEEDGDRFLEFWNLVFMQFEQVTKEERQPLPRPSIDTGMGLERMACHPAGRRQRVRDRSVPSPDRRDRVRARARAERADRRLVPRHRRPSALLGLPDRRRRAAVERGPRLCAAPDHAPRDAPCAAARRERAADASPGLGAGARDGPGLSGAGARGEADRGNAAAGRDPLPQDAGARPCRSSTRRARP